MPAASQLLRKTTAFPCRVWNKKLRNNPLPEITAEHVQYYFLCNYFHYIFDCIYTVSVLMQPSVNSDWLHRAAWPCAVLRSARVSDDAVQATVTEAYSKTTNRFLSSDIQCGISVSVWSNCLSWVWLNHVPIDTQWLFLLSLPLPADPASIASLPGSCVWAVEDPYPDPSRSPAFPF